MSLVLDDLPRDPDRLLRHLRQMTEVIAQQNAALVSLQQASIAARRGASWTTAAASLARPTHALRHHRPAVRVDPVQVEHALGEIDAENRYHHGRHSLSSRPPDRRVGREASIP
jgi:hypothetical protein